MKVDSRPPDGRWAGALYRHRTGLAAAGIASLTFFLYALTLAPGLTWRNSASDGGDLLTAAFTFGIPHPTGYPTYLLALRGFSTVMPFGSEALHGNIFSALTASAAVGLLFIATSRILRTLPIAERLNDRYILIAAGVSSASVAASRELWSQATVTEVYALNALFVSAVLLAAIGLRERQSDRRRGVTYGLGVGLLSGIALGNHLTIAALIVPLLIWGLLGGGARAIRPIHVIPIALGAVIGLAVYFYAPIASSRAPELNWGHPDTVEGFWWMVSGTIYQGYAFGVGGSELIDRLINSADLLLAQFAFFGLLLGIAGMSAIWAGLRTLLIAQIIAVAFLVAYAITYRTLDSFIYLIPAFMLFSIWMAAGVVRMLAGIDGMRKALPALRTTRRGLIAGGLVLAVLAVVPGFSLATNYGRLDLSDDREAADYAEAAFDVLGPEPIIFARTEETVFSLWYQSYVAETEREVMPVSVPHIVFDWYWDDLTNQFPERMPDTRPAGSSARTSAIIDHNLGIRPLYEADAGRVLLPEFQLVEDGVLLRIEP
ncbi:MAG: DUF2723 domain-containing protein [Chloroflexi bacterium]|nr:DUF2723 domain-containing protein [Chloroflexota bacterium]